MLSVVVLEVVLSVVVVVGVVENLVEVVLLEVDAVDEVVESKPSVVNVTISEEVELI